MVKVENAQIKSTYLGGWDKHHNGILNYWLMIDGNGWSCGFGGYGLDGDSGFCSRAIHDVLKILEVSSWEELPNQYIRVKTEGLGGKILAIGHIIKDQWFSLIELQQELKNVRNQSPGESG